jgi:signal transduction histidine kinase
LGKSIGKTRAKPLESLIPMIQAGIEEVRRIQMDLRPSLLDDLGLLATIDWFCREFQTTYSHVCIEKEIGIQESEIPESLKIVIYRILGEALHNVAKHSKADLIRLSLQKTDSTIALTIQDNGMGFDRGKMHTRESPRKGLGLISMQERTELSGGSFAFESGRKRGTVVRAVWPL